MYWLLQIIILTAGCGFAAADYWEEWSGFGPCTKSVLGESAEDGNGVNLLDGLQTRRRYCVISRDYDEEDCAEDDFVADTRPCRIPKAFPVWSVWSSYAPCSATCGEGVRRRERVCQQGKIPNPKPGPHELCFVGEKQEDVKNCKIRRKCEEDPLQLVLVPEWSSWVTGECSEKCGVGFRRKDRFCRQGSKPVPAPRSRRNVCKPGANETKAIRCEGRDCPEDPPQLVLVPEWSPWVTGECSEKCGVGFRREDRFCRQGSKPVPAPGSRRNVCKPGANETKAIRCVGSDCPVPRWTSWSNYSSCTPSCGPGVQTRERQCRLGKADPGNRKGDECEVGEIGERRKDCNNRPCLVPVWTDWSPFSECSTECGPGTRTKERTCRLVRLTDAEFRLPRENCNDGEKQTKDEDCSIKRCLVDGGWSEWTAFGRCGSPDCTPTKGQGIRSYQYSTRTCSNPFPDLGKKMCQGQFVRSGLCPRPKNCMVHGNWTEWGHWSQWDCVKLSRKRTRECTNPPPQNGGNFCTGLPEKLNTRDESPESFRKACPDEVDYEDKAVPGDAVAVTEGKDGFFPEE